MTVPVYGEKYEYDPSWKGPIHVVRTKTDPKAWSYFRIIFLVWLLLAIASAVFYTTPDKDYVKKLVDNVYRDNDITFSTQYNAVIFQISSYPFLMYAALSQHFVAAMAMLWIPLVSAFVAFLYTKFMRYAKSIFWITVGFWCAIMVLLLMMSMAYQFEGRNGIIFFLILFLVGVVGLSIYYRKKIAIACEIIKEASKTSSFFPIHHLFVVVQFILFVVIYVLECCLLQKTLLIESNFILFLVSATSLFMLLWSFYFISGFKHMVLSSSYSTWYWTMQKEHVSSDTVRISYNTIKENHLGTASVGASIMAICDIVNLVVNSIKERMGASGHRTDECAAEVFSCCCKSFLSAIMYVTRNAYVMCAVHGTDFIDSAKDVFNLVKRNLEKTLVTVQVASVVFGTGAFFVIIIPFILLMCVTDFDAVKGDDALPKFIFGNVIMFSIIAIIFVFDVINAAIDTVYISVLEDFERNDGTPSRPYYMSAKLKNLILKDQ